MGLNPVSGKPLFHYTHCSSQVAQTFLHKWANINSGYTNYVKRIKKRIKSKWFTNGGNNHNCYKII
jgi:hypothetical protein